MGRNQAEDTLVCVYEGRSDAATSSDADSRCREQVEILYAIQNSTVLNHGEITE